MSTSPLFEPPADKNHTAGWRRLVHAFEYEYATLSEADLYDCPTSMSLDNSHIEEIIGWATREGLIEAADERGRVRLTSKGRRAWRDCMGEG